MYQTQSQVQNGSSIKNFGNGVSFQTCIRQSWKSLSLFTIYLAQVPFAGEISLHQDPEAGLVEDSKLILTRLDFNFEEVDLRIGKQPNQRMWFRYDFGYLTKLRYVPYVITFRIITTKKKENESWTNDIRPRFYFQNFPPSLWWKGRQKVMAFTFISWYPFH